jgi:hypothetical protein
MDSQQNEIRTCLVGGGGGELPSLSSNGARVGEVLTRCNAISMIASILSIQEVESVMVDESMLNDEFLKKNEMWA